MVAALEEEEVVFVVGVADEDEDQEVVFVGVADGVRRIRCGDARGGREGVHGEAVVVMTDGHRPCVSRRKLRL